MKQNIYSIVLAGFSILALTGCEKETAFRFNAEDGQLNCNALTVDYINSGTRASNVYTGDFMVHFVNEQTGDTAKSYKYAQLPEIVSLPVGEYRADASYGDNKIAEWESPFYEGSSSFSIEKGKITDDVDPIECSLQNMKVAVDIVDETGMDIVDNDVRVVVKAGRDGELVYDSEHIDSIGFFRYEAGSNTIIAQLSGTLDGTYTEGITRTYPDAGAGKSYRIRFHINRPDNVGDGDIQMGDGIKVDATITIKNENHVVDPQEPDDVEEIIEDDMRPVEDNPEEPGTDPGTNPGIDPEDPGTDPGTNPEDPGKNPQTSGKAPNITGIQSNTPYEINENSKVEFTVHSETGITDFIIEIVSDNNDLSDAIEDMLGLTIDLVNPGDKKEDLESLSFPTGDNVKTQKTVDLTISDFMSVLKAFHGNHKFKMTISDTGGTLIFILWLVVP